MLVRLSINSLSISVAPSRAFSLRELNRLSLQVQQGAGQGHETKTWQEIHRSKRKLSLYKSFGHILLKFLRDQDLNIVSQSLTP